MEGKVERKHMNKYTFQQCKIGCKESFQTRITKEMMEDFRKITGDENPLHTDAEFASEKGFSKGCAVYGMLTSSFLSTLAGVYLPGENSLIQQVEVKFTKPVFVGDVLEVIGEVVERNEVFHQLVLKVSIARDKEKVLRGKMKVIVNEETV